jgi:hypothetical protein
MNMQRVWCGICNKTVEVVMAEGAASIIAPIVGGTAGAALGSAKSGARGGLAGAFLGVLAGALVHAMIPKAQRIACGGCGNHLG